MARKSSKKAAAKGLTKRPTGPRAARVPLQDDMPDEVTPVHKDLACPHCGCFRSTYRGLKRGTAPGRVFLRRQCKQCGGAWYFPSLDRKKSGN